ncbi:MAG TPA: MBL fold metallo-hydrolase [Chloroflexota bacterium]|nr:MBL fold metallo-hydrolase [Chloroflexota bacterium]
MGLEIKMFRCGPLDNGVYVLYDRDLGTAVIVDPSFDYEPVLAFIAAGAFRLEAIVNTHGHFDHMVGNAACGAAAPEAPIFLHPDDAELLKVAPRQAALFGLSVTPSPPPDRWFSEGEDVTLAGTPWHVLHVPGHSPGSVCLLRPGVLIGGDVLFQGSIGRTDLPGGDGPLLLTGIREKLLVLPDETVVYPGHGPATTIGRERAYNPFLA